MRSLRLIVARFATDAALTFAEVAMRHKELFQYYMAFQDAPDRDVWNVYLYMCQKLPEVSVPIWLEENALFQVDALQLQHQYGVPDCCFLPGLDFHEFFAAPNVSDEIRAELWVYIQGMLMLTMNAANPHLAEYQARASKSMESMFDSVLSSTDGEGEGGEAAEDGAGGSAGLFGMLNPDELSSKIDEVSARLNEFLAGAGAGAGADAGADADGMDTDADADADASPPLFDTEHIKQFTDSISDTKLGKLTMEVVQEITETRPELLREMESFFAEQQQQKGASAARPSTMSMMRFLMSKGLTVRTLMQLIKEKLKQKIASGQYSYSELMREFPGLVGKLRAMSGKDLRAMAGSAGGAGKGMQMNMNIEGLRRADNVEGIKARLRAKLNKEERATAAMMNMTTGVFGDGFDAAEALQQTQGASMHGTYAFGGFASAEEQQAKWTKLQADIVELFANNEGICGNNHHGGKKKTRGRK